MADTITETRPDTGSLAGTLEAFELENLLNESLACEWGQVPCKNEVCYGYDCPLCGTGTTWCCKEHYEFIMALTHGSWKFKCATCRQRLSARDLRRGFFPL